MWDLLSNELHKWVKDPAPFVICSLLSGFIGFSFARILTRERINTLEERIRYRDEQISLKDRSIQSSIEQQNEIEHDSRHQGDMFKHDNSYIISQLNDRIVSAIIGKRYLFTFNPITNNSKTLTFMPAGQIGEGRNANEYAWRVEQGKLEIFNSEGRVYSRFIIVGNGDEFHHTNESDTLSIRGQFLKRIN